MFSLPANEIADLSLDFFFGELVPAAEADSSNKNSLGFGLRSGE